MTDNKPVKYLGGLSGCMFGDTERVSTLADADWLTRQLTVTYRDKIMNKVLSKFHKSAPFVISLDTIKDESTMEGRRAYLIFDGLWAGDNSIEGDCEEYAKSVLQELLSVESLSANTPDGIQTIMNAIARDIPGIKNYYEF